MVSSRAWCWGLCKRGSCPTCSCNAAASPSTRWRSSPRVTRVTSTSRRAGTPHVVRFLQHLGWFEGNWTDEGRIACDHALHYGMVGSYFPMLVQLPQLLFGKSDHRTHVLGQEESHVDRRMNVLASG